jgi:hypothetical protein
MPRKMSCWKVSEDGAVRTIQPCGFSEEVLRDAAVKWPTAEIEIAHAGGYSLMPGFGKTGIPLGKNPVEAEATIRRLLTT